MGERHRESSLRAAACSAHQEREDATAEAFWTDITEDEYLRFNYLIARAAGPLRYKSAYTIFVLAMQALALTLSVVQWHMYGEVARITILFLIFMAVLGVNVLIAEPLYLREVAKRAYEQERLCGIDTAGLVEVCPDGLTMKTRTTEVQLLFAERAVYIEAPDMLVLMGPDSHVIVLTARCLTQSDAARIRQAAAAVIPKQRRHWFGAFVSKTTEHIEQPPAPAEPPEELFCFRIRYSKAEYVRLLKNIGLTTFIQRLPLYGSTALLVCLLFALLFNFGIAVLLFCSIIGICYVTDAAMAERNARILYYHTSEAHRIIRAAITIQGLVVDTPDGSMENRIPWKSVKRLVEHRDCVDFCGKTILLRIPKRYIQNLSELQKLVEQFTTVEDDLPR